MYRALYGEEPTTIDVDTGKARPPIDVAFLGESVVEAMDGRWLGKHILGGAGQENQDFRRIDKVGTQDAIRCPLLLLCELINLICVMVYYRLLKSSLGKTKELLWKV
jgi:hypothetical protein